MSILIVEDDPVSLRILELSLRKHGYQTIVAHTGREALECLTSTQEIQLVIADIMMPEMDGLELLGKMKERPEWTEIPVVMCAALADLETVKKATEMRCRHYIVKPIHTGPLLQKVREILKEDAEKRGGQDAEATIPRRTEGRYVTKILIAEDDRVSRRMLEARLVKWGYEVVVTCDGNEAWEVLQREDAPQLAILDWMMPGMDGVEVCRKVWERESDSHIYIILLTAKDRKEDIVAGLDAGADDYLTKPLDCEELRARVQVGVRMVHLQNRLTEHVRRLEEALSQVKQLQGMLPICMYCKKIRTDENYWQQVDGYVSEHSEAEFSHGICPDCYKKIVKPELEEMRQHAETA